MASADNCEQCNGSASQNFLDTKQYSLKSILKYERIFGHTWVSSGGETTTKEFCLKLNLRPGQKVLDIGCGTGGSAFYMARHYGVKVHGVDLSTNMIAIANDRLSREEGNIKEMVNFEIGDIMKVDYPHEEYDVIYSRDTILHIKEKDALFKRILPWLKPGGKLLISDYCKGDKKLSQEFLNYVNSRGYHMKTVKEYGKLIDDAKFTKVEAIDNSPMFLETLRKEVKFFTPTKESFVKDFSEDDYLDIYNGWTSKIKRVEAGDQVWGLFIATK